MPNIKSAIKRVKVNEKKNLRNRMIKSAMKTQVKKFETALAAGEVDGKLLSATQGAIDKAVTKGVIHKNAANRKKARLAKASREGVNLRKEEPAFGFDCENSSGSLRGLGCFHVQLRRSVASAGAFRTAAF